MSSGEHMNVQMIDGLPAVDAGVYDEPKPALMFSAENGSCLHQRRDFVGGSLKCMLRDIGDVPFRQNEQMHRSLRIHILDRDDAVFSMNDFCGNLARHDFTENAIAFRRHFGCRYSNAMCVSGLGTNPAMDDFTMTGTVVCTMGSAGT